MAVYYEQPLGDSILRATGLADSALPKTLLAALRERLDRYFVTISADVKRTSHARSARPRRLHPGRP